ncbi:hypothetical protein UUU_22020 [Klebsiella pneumoniae subsp. pneumoniae DSM 30104 = JCM 1662 = NBRC 14940]|nr:hypothetical protein UUU_22020 [Klebsiella pneumoniae subsp. pneumoniae DSM 30104 = JCM 1662 = NBRC 14940]
MPLLVLKVNIFTVATDLTIKGVFAINHYPPLWFETKYQMELNAGITLAAKLSEWKSKDTQALLKARSNYQAKLIKKAI